MTGRRIGVFGGTFDPIHAGHLELARSCRSELGLTEVRLVTNATAPHKPPAEASELHRHAMVALATAGDAGLLADPRELERRGRSYTVDTLEQVHREFPGADLFFLAGADSLRDLESWHRWRDVVALATFVAVRRAGLDPGPLASRLGDEVRERVIVMEHEPPPWSASELRRRLGEGEVPAGALAEPVLEYVMKHDIYGAAGARRRKRPA